MGTNRKYEDNALRTIMHHRAESADQMKLSEGFTNRLMERIQQREVSKTIAQKRRRIWLCVGMVASVALLVVMGFLLLRHTDCTPQTELAMNGTATTDSIKDSIKESTTQDTTNIMQEIERIRYEAPKRPMAKAHKVPTIPIAPTPDERMEDTLWADSKDVMDGENESIEDMKNERMHKELYEKSRLFKTDIKAYYEWVEAEIQSQTEEMEKMERELATFKGF
jgi:hypothetical protein